MMAPKTLVLLVLLATTLVIMPAFASGELVQNAQQKAKVMGSESIYKIINVVKRMLSDNLPPTYTQPPECSTNCLPP